MQLAINAVILFIVVTVVAKLIQFRKAPISQFIKKLGFITNGFKLWTPPSKQEEALRTDDVNEAPSSPLAELLTRFATYSSGAIARLTCYQD